MHRLQPGKWLNDEVINYYFKLLARRDERDCSPDSNQKKSHFFKSFFMSKLLNENHSDTSKQGTYEYTNVENWSRHVPGGDIFNLDKLFFPVHVNGNHWICVVVNMTEKRIEAYDSGGSGRMKYVKSVFQYIQDEHTAKKGVPLPDLDEWGLVSDQLSIPRQGNGVRDSVFRTS